jgi:6-phosphogluconolactonase
MANVELIPFANDTEMARAAAAAWLDAVAAANARATRYAVALSGGRGARVFFAAAATLGAARPIPPARVQFFWADERCVPPHDAESNFRLANEFLFSPLKTPESQIHRIRGEMAPEAAARAAEAELRGIVACDANGQPLLDLILLGLGEDGHVASLFPNEPEVVRSSPAIYRAVTNAPKPPPNRVTLGYPAMAAAREVWVLVSGAGKAAALRNSLDPAGQTPLARVIQSRTRTRIFLDRPLEAS